ncbi:MAG: GGDEF domain-containing protein [Kangiellaceae bacterium]|nr:GGDEF domain-containing protein [Kangiellaceae bacterium]
MQTANYSQSELVHSVSVFKDTVPLMRSNGIPLTPENYALWYTYSNGSVDGLNQAINKNLERGIEFSKRLNRELYDEYIETHDSQALDGYHEATKELIEKLLLELKEVSGGSDEYLSSMEMCEKQLRENPDVSQLNDIVGQVIEKTKNINETNKGLAESLKKMEEEVNTLKSGVESLTEQANTDQLTKIANRRGFELKYELFEQDFKENGNEFSLLLIDIDHFKKFNDTHGHTIGDKVLSYVAGTLNSAIDMEDIAARFGGEEFVIALKNTNQEKAMQTADKLRVIVSNKKLRSNQAKGSLGNVTISIGVATIKSDEDFDSLMDRADKAMYQAKSNGRNKVCGQLS